MSIVCPTYIQNEISESKRLVFFGDSWVRGDGLQDLNIIHKRSPKSFANSLRKKLGTEYLNFACSGAGNDEISRSVFHFASNTKRYWHDKHLDDTLLNQEYNRSNDFLIIHWSLADRNFFKLDGDGTKSVENWLSCNANIAIDDKASRNRILHVLANTDYQEALARTMYNVIYTAAFLRSINAKFVMMTSLWPHNQNGKTEKNTIYGGAYKTLEPLSNAVSNDERFINDLCFDNIVANNNWGRTPCWHPDKLSHFKYAEMLFDWFKGKEIELEINS